MAPANQLFLFSAFSTSFDFEHCLNPPIAFDELVNPGKQKPIRLSPIRIENGVRTWQRRWSTRARFSPLLEWVIVQTSEPARSCRKLRPLEKIRQRAIARWIATAPEGQASKPKAAF